MRERLSACGVLLVLGGLTAACSSDDRERDVAERSGTGGANGASGGSAGASGASGAAGGSGASSGGGATGGSGGNINPEDVDLTLGGLHRDLPEPPVDCTDLEGASARCLSFSAVIDGQSLAYACKGSEIVSGAGEMRGLGCTGAMNGERWSMGIAIGADAISGVPGRYEIHATRADPIDYDSISVQYDGVPGETSQKNFEELRLNGWVVRVTPELSKTEVDQITGAFAASWGEPDPRDEECAEDAFGNHCAPIRVRGTFKANVY